MVCTKGHREWKGGGIKGTPAGYTGGRGALTVTRARGENQWSIASLIQHAVWKLPRVGGIERENGRGPVGERVNEQCPKRRTIGRIVEKHKNRKWPEKLKRKLGRGVKEVRAGGCHWRNRTEMCRALLYFLFACCMKRDGDCGNI